MPVQDGLLSPEQLTGLLTAIAALIGALGLRAVWDGRKERERQDPPAPPPALVTRERFDEEIEEVKGLIRAHHQETRIEARDARDRLVQIGAKLDHRRRG
ncbi:MAG: hypothetical protein ACU0B9_07370 [Limimaricola soesokkakensis]|uniref:hypothetical protein n=1 Tax=Limimaricola soesokkakensis TaxID=1343159 RepID=UPI0040581BA3